MARARLHDPDTILDAARGLLLEDGARAATVAAIASASGAPTGSIYHEFGSRGELLVRLWIRAVRGSQERFTTAIRTAPDARAGAVAAALSVFDVTDHHLADARLLVSLRRRDLLGEVTNPALHTELERLNEPMERVTRDLARDLASSDAPDVVARVALATVDLPLGAVRRFIADGRRPPLALREPLRAAVEAVIDDIERSRT
jgi:AcrR family transcriptional regulator